MSISSRLLPKRSSMKVPKSSFSTSSCLQVRKKARGNRLRGMSALKGTGVAPWIPLTVSKQDLRTPRNISYDVVPDVDRSHGLWGFFNDKGEMLTAPVVEMDFGRAWAVAELRTKSF